MVRKKGKKKKDEDILYVADNKRLKARTSKVRARQIAMK
jgi:hypothetical protein